MPEGEYRLVVANPKTADKIQQIHQGLKKKGCVICLTKSVPAGLRAYPDFIIERAILPVYVAGIDQARNGAATPAKPGDRDAFYMPATPPAVIELGTGEPATPPAVCDDVWTEDDERRLRA